MAAVAEAVGAKELLAREAAGDVGDAVLALIICGGSGSVRAMGAGWCGGDGMVRMVKAGRWGQGGVGTVWCGW